MLNHVQELIERLKRESLVLYYAYTNPNLSLWKKMFIALVIGYLFSPIDLIPDFIPVIGYLDDLLIVPLGIFISLKIIPEEILVTARERVSAGEINNIPIGYKTAALIIIIWCLGIIGLVYWIFIHYFQT